MHSEASPTLNKPSQSQNEASSKIKKKYAIQKSNSMIWSLLVFILNVFMLFTTTFWASLDSLPTGGPLLCTLACEAILFFEGCFRLSAFAKAREFLEYLELMHTRPSDGIVRHLLIFLSSFPFMLIATLISSLNQSESTRFTSQLCLLKLIRMFEITRFVDRLEEKLFYKSSKAIIIIRFIYNIGIIGFTTHSAACFWILIQITSKQGWGNANYEFTNPLNPYGPNETYFTRLNLNNAPNLRKYIDSLLWAICAMSGCTFGDVTPRCINEIAITLIVFVIGATTLAKIFGDFASLNHLLSLEATQKQQKQAK